MIALVIGLLLLFFRSHGLTPSISNGDTCCKVQVQEKTGVTTSISVPVSAKNVIAPSRQSSESYCVFASCKTITFSKVFFFDSRQIDSCLSAFQNRCSSSSELVFENVKFSRNEFSKNWITLTNFTVVSIRFEDSPIKSIQSRAFQNQIFAETKQFQLINTNISDFHQSIFNELPNLRNLAVQNNLITFADPDLLSAVSETLETLELDWSIKNLDVLRNITFEAKPLFNVQLLSLQGNNISVLSKDILSVFPNLQSLYLDSSKIFRITSDAFDGLATIKQLFLRNNQLSELPNTVFNSILTVNKGFQVTLTNNPWKCDCKLVWLQKLMEEFPNLVAAEPICASPEENKNLGFLEANFCGIDESAKISCNNSRDLIEININCAKKRAIRDALSEGNVSLAGYDCVWKSVLIRKDSECAKLWLSNEDKAVVLSLYTIGTVFFGLLCAGGCFLIVRKYPGLLKGSERVVMVKRGGINAMVLPKGVKIDVKENKGEIDYLTPIGDGNEYESIKEGGKEESKSDNCPPPLPPHPFHGVRTVSLLMEGIDGKREIIDDHL